MTDLSALLRWRCGQCGGDGWAPASHRGPVLCQACGHPMVGPPRQDDVVGAPLWIETQNFPRGWLGRGG